MSDAPGGSLTLNNMKLIMQQCSEIIVERGGYLEADNSHIGVCDTGWKGIEVWGNIDACASDYSIQGQFIGNHTTIDHADIGIFAGTRITPAPLPDDRRMWGGGRIAIDYCTFKDNYVDVMFSEYQGAGPCAGYCSPNFSWRSHGYNNQFLQLRSTNGDERCADTTGNFFVDNALTTYSLSRCHIIDFNLNPSIWSIPTLCTLNFCGNTCSPPDPTPYTIDQHIDLNPGSPTYGLLIWNNNIYDSSCPNATYH